MPPADFFARLGLFIVRDFFNAGLCERIRVEARLAGQTQAVVVDKRGVEVDEDFRRTKQAEMSATTIFLVQKKLIAVKPELETHFNVPLAGCESLQFLVYKTGDFFRAHDDYTDDPDYPAQFEYVRKRKVSVVIFLNSQAEEPEPESYSGGALTLYGLIDDPRLKTYGFPLRGEAGVLMAFRSDVVHEVTPVTQGERYTIVSWFF
jgi:SM-20-related protein